MIDKQQLKLHFSKNASSYDKYAKVQKKMRDNLLELLLESVQTPSGAIKILEVGCGTGYLTSELIRLFPSARITAIDIAQGMISEIKVKLNSNPSVDFVCGDIEELNLDINYDIIISNATFQWFNNTQSTLKKLYDKLNPGGILCFSTFGNETFCELNKCFKTVSRIHGINETILSGQAFYSLEELTSLCKDSLEIEVKSASTLFCGKENFEYEYFDNCRSFFGSIKKIGANNSNENNRCTSPTFIKNVMALYDKNFKMDNKVKVTYHCLFFNITKIG